MAILLSDSSVAVLTFQLLFVLLSKGLHQILTGLCAFSRVLDVLEDLAHRRYGFKVSMTEAVRDN